MLAMLRTVKASPGSRLRVTDGHTRESAQANTMYCSHQTAGLGLFLYALSATAFDKDAC
jgi:hypothetical protein